MASISPPPASSQLLSNSEKLKESVQCLVTNYTAEIGTRELTGRNDGVRVEAYLKSVGLKKGQPWCAAFVCYTLQKCGLPSPRSGFSPALFRRAFIVSNRSNIPNYSFQRADVFGLYYKHLGRIGHVGFIDSANKKHFITVEGNTNAQGSREGNGVWRKRRSKLSIHSIARYA